MTLYRNIHAIFRINTRKGHDIYVVNIIKNCHLIQYFTQNDIILSTTG
jgi:hypothetical protein